MTRLMSILLATTVAYLAIGLSLLSVPVRAENTGPYWIDIGYMPALPEGGIAAVSGYTIPAPFWLDLQDAKRLPKPMYSWPVDLEVLREPTNFAPLKEFARITGSLGIGDPNVGWTPEDWVYANDIAMAAGVGLTFNTSPYHRVGHCNEDYDDWSDTGLEIGKTARYLQHIKTLGLRINAIAFDSECYKATNDKVTARLDVMYQLAKLFYPDVPFFWYRNGDWLPLLPAQTDCEVKPSCNNVHSCMRSIVQYRTYSSAHTEKWLNLWEMRNATKEQYPEEEPEHVWSVWTTLGPGYRDGWQWELDLADEEYEYLARMHMADDRIKALIVYPHPFRPITNATDAGGIKAFLAYVRGATER